MTDANAATQKMTAALLRLEQAVDRKLAEVTNRNGSPDSDSLKAENQKLQEEIRRLRNANQNSAKKIDLAITRMNNVINAS